MSRNDALYRPNVGIIVINEYGEILVGERAAIKGAWQMPQGGIDDGETPEEAAWRELMEETGLKSPDVELVSVRDDWVYYDFPSQFSKRFSGEFVGQRQKWFTFKLVNEKAAPDLSGFVSDEFDFFKWVGKEWLIENVHPMRTEVYKIALADL